MSAQKPTPTAEREAVESTPKRAVIYLRVSTADQAQGADAEEGYSIPAQREACHRKAADLSADVIAEFVDRGESARSAARPDLQRMLKRLSELKDVDYVIIHKIDRLARNRADDVQIQLGIEKSGAQLVSVTENIDASPSGQLVRNIMADLAEFYSANLAVEILKGSTQKARMGGTPYKAPVGYLNVRRFIEGREVRTIEVDPEQAPLVQRAFELYAGGNYSTRQLHKLMSAEGLRRQPTTKRAGGPLVLSKFWALLRNRYYLGVVPYRGVEYPGNHPGLVEPEIFERVQSILDEREQTSIKPRLHFHYLRGLLTCARCGSRLQYTKGRNRHGTEFEYYLCAKRHRGGKCDLPYLPVWEVERRLEHTWPLAVHLDAVDGEEVGRQLHDAIFGDSERPQRLARAQQRLERLEAQRHKLVQMAYEDAIPLDLLKSEQARLTREREAAARQVAEASEEDNDVLALYQEAKDLMQRGAAVYQSADPETRRLLHSGPAAGHRRVGAARPRILTDEPRPSL